LWPFTLPDASARAVSVSEYRQRADLVLFFHQGAACGACRALLYELVARTPAYQAAAAVVRPLVRTSRPAHGSSRRSWGRRFRS
jgi:peroxiredoxin